MTSSEEKYGNSGWSISAGKCINFWKGRYGIKELSGDEYKN